MKQCEGCKSFKKADNCIVCATEAKEAQQVVTEKYFDALKTICSVESILRNIIKITEETPYRDLKPVLQKYLEEQGLVQKKETEEKING